MITLTSNIEITLLLEAIYLKYGYDFRNYARGTIERRVQRVLEDLHLESISHLQHVVLTDKSSFEMLLQQLSINTTEMFRDADFFRALREQVLPLYAGEPMLKIWHAGCSTGEEVYSMAILLAEAGLAGRSRIYATDFDEVVLAKAKEGIFSVDRIQNYTANYQKAGGQGSFGDYYRAHYDSAMITPTLRQNIIFSDHNLVTDGVFAEVDIVICRNVMIYFSRDLQSRVFHLFTQSLADGGLLCIGSRETIQFSDCEDQYEPLVERQRIYRKKTAQP